MTHLERVLKAVAHEQPDRIPLDLGSTLVTGITKNAYLRLAAVLNPRPEQVRLYDTIQQLPVIDEGILELLDVDTRGVIPNFVRKNPALDTDGESQWFVDEWAVRWERPQGASYFTAVNAPFSGNISESDIEKIDWPDGGSDGLFEGLVEQAKSFHQAGYAVILENICAGIFEMCCRVRGTENFLMDLALNPDLACKLLDKFTEIKIAYYKAAADKLGPYIQFVREVDDIAGQQALLMSPKTYRELIKPRHKRLFEAQKKYFPQPFYVWFHSDGAIFDLIGDFIEIGMDVLNPVQLSAKDMDAEKLKAEYGNYITFWGAGADTQGILPHGTPGEIKRDVKSRITQLATGGGYVFGAVHNIQDDVPAENIAAMLEAFREFRDYY